MDGLQLALERLLMGAHATLEIDRDPCADWLAEELRKTLALFPERTKGATVKVLSETKIEIDFPGRSVRVLAVTEDRQWWGLADAMNVETPGQVAAVLATP